MGEEPVFAWVLVETAGTQLHYSLGMNIKGLQLLPDDALRHSPSQVLHQLPHTTVIRKRGVESHNLPLIKGPQYTDDGSKTVGGFSAFTWAVRPTGQVARNQARKARVSCTIKIKMALLLGLSCSGKQILVTWALVVVPSGISLRCSDMSLDMRLLTVSEETPRETGLNPWLWA